MTKDEIAPILLAGFLAGGVITAALGVETTNSLRRQHIEQAKSLEMLSIAAGFLTARFAALDTLISKLDQRWENDIQRARNGPGSANRTAQRAQQNFRMVGQPATRTADE